MPGSLPSTQASVRSEESKPKWAGSHHRLLDTKIDLGSFVQFSVQTMVIFQWVQSSFTDFISAEWFVLCVVYSSMGI